MTEHWSPDISQIRRIIVIRKKVIHLRNEKVYYVPGYGEFDTKAKKYVDKLNKLHPCSKVELFQHSKFFHYQPTSWKMVQDIKPDFQKIIKLNPKGIHLIGLSQGGHLARALIQETPEHNVESFISISGAHNGVFGIPYISIWWPIVNNITRTALFNDLMYTPVMQKYFPYADLWRDPLRYSTYLKKNVFLPTLNNEKPHPKAKSYKNSLLKLKHFVLITGQNDTIVYPYQSSIFGFFDKNLNIVNVTRQEIYKNDTLGLKTLNEDGRLHICSRPNLNHVSVREDSWTIKNCILPYLT